MTSIGRFQSPSSTPLRQDAPRRTADAGDFADHLATTGILAEKNFSEGGHGHAHAAGRTPSLTRGHGVENSTARQVGTKPQAGMPALGIDQASTPPVGAHLRPAGLAPVIGNENRLQGLPDQACSDERGMESGAAPLIHDPVGELAVSSQPRNLRGPSNPAQFAVRSVGNPPDQKPSMAEMPGLSPFADGQSRASIGEACLVPGDSGAHLVAPPATSQPPVDVGGSAQAGQISWSRVFSQHWLANGYLSLVQVAPKDAPAPILSPSVAATSPSRSSPAQTKAPIALSVGKPPDGGILPPWLASDRGVSRLEADAPDIAQRLSHALGPIIAADRSWPERLLRLSGREQGAATVWLRDYSLQPVDLERTIGTLRRHAAQEGVEVGRIVVNGHTVWRAVSRQGSE